MKHLAPLASAAALIWMSCLPAQVDWRAVSPGSSVPSMLTPGASSSYDLVRRVWLLLVRGVNAVPSETWEFDGVSWRRHIVSAAPSHGVMAFDPIRRYHLLVTADSRGQNLLTWTWDGLAWVQRSPPTSPAARTHCAVAFDPGRGEIVLYGGEPTAGWSSTAQEMWSWDGDTWSQLRPSTQPPPRQRHSLVTNWRSGEVVMFGGYTPHPPASRGGTWLWDGQNWREVVGGAEAPFRFGASSGYDLSGDRIVRFGGHDVHGVSRNDLWEFDDFPRCLLARARAARYRSTRGAARCYCSAASTSRVLF